MAFIFVTMFEICGKNAIFCKIIALQVENVGSMLLFCKQDQLFVLDATNHDSLVYCLRSCHRCFQMSDPGPHFDWFVL